MMRVYTFVLPIVDGVDERLVDLSVLASTEKQAEQMVDEVIERSNAETRVGEYTIQGYACMSLAREGVS